MGLQYLKVEKRRKTQQRRVKEWLVIDENQECDIQEGKEAALPQMAVFLLLAAFSLRLHKYEETKVGLNPKKCDIRNVILSSPFNKFFLLVVRNLEKELMYIFIYVYMNSL